MSGLRLDRRTLLFAGAAAASVAPAIAFSEQFSRTGIAWWPNTAAYPLSADLGGGYKYFTADEAKFIEAACARLIPKDAVGPGAIDAGVPLFIDRQLAGDYGSGERWYMKGPYGKSTGTQGYQSQYPPAGQYRAAIKAIGAHLSGNGKAFHERTPEDQDAFLKDLQAGKVDLGSDVDSKAYFTLLLQNVMEGYFSDPIYGGNRDMAAWKMIGFSGARYDQRPYVLAYGKPYPLPPVSIAGRPAWSAKS
jgi:gluconate 2-dehydrogenase gamma chain